MAKIVLEENTSAAGSGEYPVLSADTIIGVEVSGIIEKPAENKKTGETWQKLEFTFIITTIPSQLGPDLQTLEGSRIWGSTGLRFTMHPDNKLRQWVEALLGGLELDPGFELDTDNLIGRRARAIVGNYPKKDGRQAHQVVGLLPSADSVAAPVASPAAADIFEDNATDDPPF